MAATLPRRAPPPAKALAARRALCADRLKLERQMAPLAAQAAELDAKLKAIATDQGDSFKEDFGGEGFVAASGRIEAEFKGELPVVQVEAFTALKPAERARLCERGLIRMEQNFSRPSNGRVTVKLL